MVYDTPQNDPISIIIGKYDAESEFTWEWEENLAQGNASLAGAEFNVSYYDGFFETAEDAINSGSPLREWQFATDFRGYVSLSFGSYHIGGDGLYYSEDGQNVVFPLGTYLIQETKPADGYLLNDEIYVRNVTADGSVEDVYTYNAVEVPELIKRSDVSFSKHKQNDSGLMAHVAFLITSETTGEAHVVETDENGYYSSENSWNEHSVHTNANDDALKVALSAVDGYTYDDSLSLEENLELVEDMEGDYCIDSSLLDNTAGTWFGEEAGISSDRGAFLYDTYTIEELSCTANADTQLIESSFIVDRDSTVISLGTFEDDEAFISTQAKDGSDGDHYVVTDDESVIIDTLSYANLIENKTYTAKTTLVDLTDNNQVLATSSTTFIPDTANGSVDIEISYDTTNLTGHELAITEELLCSGRSLATHNADLDETEQVISVISPLIHTYATDSADNDSITIADPEMSVADIVYVSNLNVGTNGYVLVGQLMLKQEDDKGNVYAEKLLDADGSEITSMLSLVDVESPDGLYEIDFGFDGSDLLDGSEIVVYEYLYKNDNLIAFHTDPEDSYQTI
ncbi:MAG: VaFE repeat-containing surface-anchored protein [Eggerthellaceae bacterium]|nr:VaFE repeat-containing surface-anchored protein [Eggerthellaceae bacterium]